MIPETLVQTFRHALVSTSKTSTVKTREIASIVHKWGSDRKEPAYIHLRRFCMSNLAAELDRRLQVNDHLLDPEIDYINIAHKGLCHRFMQGSGFVKNTLNGDVGIVFGISHSVAQAISATPNCDLSFKHSINNHFNVFFHAQVILSNGNYTTWRIVNLEPLVASEGLTAFTETDFE